MGPSERELYALCDRSPIGMFRATEDGSIRYANRALADMLGYSVPELLAKNLGRDIYDDPAERDRLIERARPTGGLDGSQARWRTRDGRRLTVRLYCQISTDPVPSFDSWVLDVTDALAQRDELKRTALILDLVVRQMPALYWVTDRELRMMRTGGAVLELMGYPPDRFVGLSLHTAHREDPGTADPIAAHQRALAGETYSYDTTFKGKQLAVTVAPLRAADGTITGVIGSALDVTAARSLERRLVDAQHAESLGVLAGGLAHDFNNLLVAVLGNADLALREIPIHTPGRSAIENIRDAGLRAAELTDQLLAYAGRRGAGTTRVHPASVVDELLRITATALPSQLRIAVDVPGELVVHADPSQLRQVLLNLIANARDALGNRAGSIAVRARELDHDGGADPDDVLAVAAGAYVLLEVSDNGPGMDVDTRRHVFEPFYTTKPTGHGLGLAAVLGIVRAHGGGVRLRTSPEHGASFHVLWPGAGGPLRAPSVPPVAARTVLVIDDEDMVRDVVARMIQDLGYAAVTAHDGATALDVIDRQSIDAVLVDLTMPRMSGADVIAALRARRPDLPVVVCSGYDRGGRGPVKADAYLPKPFRIDALERTLAKLLP